MILFDEYTEKEGKAMSFSATIPILWKEKAIQLQKFPRQTVAQSADYANFAEVQAAKPSSRRERQIAGCENVLPLGAANCKLRNRPPAGSGKLQAAKISSHQERQIAAINRRGVSHTPEYIRNDKWAHSGRMRYAPTSIFTQ